MPAKSEHRQLHQTADATSACSVLYCPADVGLVVQCARYHADCEHTDKLLAIFPEEARYFREQEPKLAG